MRSFKPLTTLLATAGLSLGLMAFSGCDSKETVLDIETPGGEIEIDRDRDTGKIDVEVNDK